MGKSSKARSFFFSFCRKFDKEPTLQEFMEATGLKKSSYYQIRQEYRWWQMTKDVVDWSDVFYKEWFASEEPVEGGEVLP